jgi:hypothetical protein
MVPVPNSNQIRRFTIKPRPPCLCFKSVYKETCQDRTIKSVSAKESKKFIYNRPEF